MTTRHTITPDAPTIRRRPRSPREDLEGVTRIVATAYLEIRDGHRGWQCLRRHVTPDVADHLGVVARRGVRRGSRPARPLRTVWSAHEGRVEACVVLRRERRVEAVAMRLEIRDGRWLVTALSAPEDATVAG